MTKARYRFVASFPENSFFTLQITFIVCFGFKKLNEVESDILYGVASVTCVVDYYQSYERVQKPETVLMCSTLKTMTCNGAALLKKSKTRVR